MLFATFFLSYALYRSKALVWPPLGSGPIPLTLPALNTLVIALSSFTYGLYRRFWKAGDRFKARRWWLMTFALGMIFLVLQFKLWSEMKAEGVLANSGIFFSLVYAITWVHAAHLLAGLLALLYLVPTLGLYGAKRQVDFTSRICSVGKFWHFLGITWLFIFVGLFVY